MSKCLAEGGTKEQTGTLNLAQSCPGCAALSRGTKLGSFDRMWRIF